MHTSALNTCGIKSFIKDLPFKLLVPFTMDDKAQNTFCLLPREC